MPDFQREEVWSTEKKRNLIDTILRGWHLPKFYFQKNDDDKTYECVDGQQRLVAIFEFFDNQLKLDDDQAAEHSAATYSQLPDEISDDFDDFEVDIEEIEDVCEDELNELFLRLQLGQPLITSEKLNAVPGKMRDFAHTVAEKPFFTKKVTLRDTRYAHFDIAVKWLFIEGRGIQTQMRLKQLEGFLRQNREFKTASDLGKTTTSTMDYLNRAFPKKCDRLRVRANVLSVCMLASRVVAQGIPKKTAPQFGAFIESFFTQLTTEIEKGARSTRTDMLRYQSAISSASTGGDSIRTRINILMKSLATFDPTFAPMLDGTDDSRKAVNLELKDLAETVGLLVHAVNDKYSAIHGEDLFKLTNKSTKALKTIEKPCRDVEAYGQLIDALYFLVYEGSGSCKRLATPPPAFSMDVKFLRTELRHDLDHGPDKGVAKKRKRNTEVFRNYSSKSTVHDCESETFLLVQLRLLESLRDMLSTL